MVNIILTGYHAGRSETSLGVDNSMIDLIIDAWKQLVNQVRQLIKQRTKPLASRLLLGSLADVTRSRVDPVAENALPTATDYPQATGQAASTNSA
jgi:hypothetical protein